MIGGIAGMQTIPSEYQGPRLPPQLQKKRLQRALECELTAKQRRAVVDYYLRGMRVSEMAELYGVNKSTVSRTLQRGVARLRRVLRY